MLRHIFERVYGNIISGDIPKGDFSLVVIKRQILDLWYEICLSRWIEFYSIKERFM